MLKTLVVLCCCSSSAACFPGSFSFTATTAPASGVRALTWHIGLSLAVFIILLAGLRFGLIPGYSQ